MPIDHSVPTRPFRRARLGVVSAAVAALWGPPVGAENKSPPASRAPLGDTVIVYEAPDRCPSQAEFEARLRSRMPARESTSTSPRRLEARFQRNGARIGATLALTDASGATTTRRIVAATCNEAVDALALIVALTVDPAEAHTGATPPAPSTDASSSGESGDSSQAEGGGSAHDEATASPQTPSQESTAPKHEPEPPRAPQAEIARANESIDSEKASRRVRFGASASFFVATGVAPGASPGGELAVAISSPSSPALSLRVGGRVVSSASATSAQGSASFSWWSGFAGGCAGSSAVAEFVLSGCVGYELGRLAASGSETRNPASGATTWQALGPELRFEWAFASPFALHAGIAAMFPLRAARFWLGDEVVYPVPAVGIRGAIGAAVRF